MVTEDAFPVAGIPVNPAEENLRRMQYQKMLSKPAAWASGWTSAALCFSAAMGYWLAGEHKRAICWGALGALGAVEVGAIIL